MRREKVEKKKKKQKMECQIKVKALTTYSVYFLLFYRTTFFVFFFKLLFSYPLRLDSINQSECTHFKKINKEKPNQAEEAHTSKADATHQIQ